MAANKAFYMLRARYAIMLYYFSAESVEICRRDYTNRLFSRIFWSNFACYSTNNKIVLN